PPRCVVVIEDVDRAFHARERTEDANKNLTFSGLLNAIDGISAKEGRILVLTTNHPEVLDPALVRPGRVDRKFEVGYCRPTEAAALYARFFDGGDYEAALLACEGM